jgi:hypothetical protein
VCSSWRIVIVLVHDDEEAFSSGIVVPSLESSELVRQQSAAA